MNSLVVVPRIVNRVGEYYQFPLGIAYISSALREAGFLVHAVNLNHVDGLVRDILADEIRRHRIDVVLTGGLTGQYGAIRAVLEATKAVSAETVTVVGGGIITSAPEHGMEALELADYGVIGEGEIITSELCRALQTSRDARDVPGIVYRDGPGFALSRGQVAPIDIERLPLPDYERLGLDLLLATVPNIVGMSDEGTVSIITSRSCPFRCTFCFHSSGQSYRERSLDSVFAEIDHLVQTYNVRYLAIQDELFGRNFGRVRAFCKRIEPYGLKWWAQFRVTDITRELVAMVKAAGCAAMGFGIESGDNRILKSMKKGTTVEANQRALEIVYRAGLGIQGAVIMGDVAETVETARNTIDWWKRFAHYELQLSMIVTYPGTELYQNARTRGLIPDPVQYIRDGCPLVKQANMSDDEYRWLLGQVLSLPRSILNSPRDAAIVRIDYGNARIDMSGSCVSCGASNEWKGVRLFITESLMCSACGRRHTAVIPDEIMQRVGGAVDRLLAQFGKVAFWGINSYFYAFVEKTHLDARDGVFFIDASEVRQGVAVGSRKIVPPAIIEEEGIRCVVVAVVQYFASLKDPIAKSHPSVEKVFSIADLLADERLAESE